MAPISLCLNTERSRTADAMWKLIALTALAHGLVPKLPARSVRASRSALQMHDFDYDVVFVGCGVGGHGAALHARSQGLSCAVLSGGDVGGTCVNRGCVPSKALLAASGRVRDMGDEKHLESMGITVPGGVEFDRAGVAAHAEQLVNKVRGGLEGSLGRLGVELIPEFGAYGGPNTVELGNGKKVTAQDIILAPGSVPFVPPGVTIDGETVYTSDEGLRLEHVPEYCAIIGSGIIGLEFSDVYTALGSECTLIEALPKLMPAFDREIAKQAERLLLTPRGIDYRTGVFASKVTPGKLGEKPVVIEMIDAETKELVEVLEVDTCMVATGRVPNTGKLGLDKHGIETPRGFVQVDETMKVLTGPDGAVADEHLYCIGDANGIQMLAHTASTQGVSAIENICGRKHVVNHRAGRESEIPNFKASYLGRFPLVLADFWTSDHLLERSRSVDAFSGTRARETLTLKRLPRSTTRTSPRRASRTRRSPRSASTRTRRRTAPRPRASSSARPWATSARTRRRSRRARATASPRCSSTRTRSRSSASTSSASTPRTSSRSAPTPRPPGRRCASSPSRRTRTRRCPRSSTARSRSASACTPTRGARNVGRTKSRPALCL